MRVKSKRLAGLLVVGALAGASLLSTACGDLAKRLTSKVGAVNMVLQTRDPFGVAPPQVGAVVNFIAIEGSLASPTASPIAGANVTLSVGSGTNPTIANLNESAPGSYEAVAGSSGAPAFAYSSNQTYSITMNVVSGDFAGTYTTKLTAPRETEVSGLPDTLGGQTITAGAPMTLTLTSGPYDYGIVVVLASGGTVTYSNKPQTPQEFLDFALKNFSGTIDIPGTAFPDPGKTYGIVVSGMKKAKTADISPNLEILSRFMAGSAKTAIVVTGP